MNRGRHNSRNAAFIMQIINHFINYIPNNFYKYYNPAQNGWRIETSYTNNNFRTTRLCTPIHNTLFHAVNYIKDYLQKNNVSVNTQLCLMLKHDYYCVSKIYIKWKG